MWLYHCVFVLFLCIVNCLKLSSQDNGHIKLRAGDPELVFTDVIKNISRVNNVLQELINNYEQLKNLYKSQEKSETIESDTEIDEVFKAKEKDKGRTTKKALPVEDFPATQMFWSDGEEKSNSASVGNEKHKSNIKNVPTKDITEKARDNSYSDQSTGESTDTSGENENNNSKRKKTKPALRHPPEILFIDTQKTTKNTEETKSKAIRSIPITINKVFDAKTILVENEAANNTNNVQKVVRAELFSKNNIWNEILKNKPIQLKRSHVDYSSTRKPGNETKRVHLRSVGKNDIRSAIQDTNIIKNIKDNPQKIRDVSFDQTEDEGVIKKEQFKTDVLRTAYGDACLKLVVTKCRRACTAARKSVCRSHNCKNNFKNMYKTSARKGCRKEFWGEEPGKTGKDEEASSMKLLFRGVHTDKQATENSEFADLTRSGFLSAACLPAGQDTLEPHKDAFLRNVSQADLKKPDMALNILRDRYEDACKKISAGKCKKACSFAYSAACQGSCNNSKKEAFKKSCNRECKSAYKISQDSSASDYYDETDDDAF